MGVPKNYLQIQPEVLHYLWLEEGECPAYQVATALEASDYVVRRSLKHMAGQGLVKLRKGERVSLRASQFRRMSQETGPAGSEAQENRRLNLVLQENHVPSCTPDMWSITEKGIQRVMES